MDGDGRADAVFADYGVEVGGKNGARNFRKHKKNSSTTTAPQRVSRCDAVFFNRRVFQQTGKQDNAGRFECGYLKVTTENLTNWDLPGCEKPPKTNNRDALKSGMC